MYDQNTVRLLKTIGRCEVCPYLDTSNCPGIEVMGRIVCGGGIHRHTYVEWMNIRENIVRAK